MPDVREEFEKWYAAEFFEGDSDAAAEWLVKEPVCGAYLYRRPAEFFMVWQASRAALKVELPKLPPHANSIGDYARGFMAARSASKEALQQAGIEVAK
ncbi:hypothetical protein ACNFH8_28860 [Pseudomonas sp. NY15436]|uniref:hypothetical protein n=1 Tax=Pseudomonas sp. NY15436 TaxID=3400359 RepID=UPI003A87288C